MQHNTRHNVSSKKDRTEHKDTELRTYKTQQKFQKNNKVNTFHKVIHSFLQML